MCEFMLKVSLYYIFIYIWVKVRKVEVILFMLNVCLSGYLFYEF